MTFRRYFSISRIVAMEAPSFVQTFAKMNLCEELQHKLNISSNSSFIIKVQKSLDIIKESFSKYPGDDIAISFNGGKDSTVLLHLIMYSAVKLGKLNTLKPTTPIEKIEQGQTWLKAIYFEQPNCFGEITDFTLKIASLYGLSLTVCTKPIKEGLFEILSKPGCKYKVIFLGTRQSDLTMKLSYFQETDNGWPSMLRVQPLLDWNYQEIWQYILALKVPYCCLYDKGYTSLGGKTDTIPNPDLKKNDGGFLAAYHLRDSARERAGRKKSLVKTCSN